MLLAITPDQLVPRDHPVREIKVVVEQALNELSPVFERMYARIGRPSIPPEAESPGGHPATEPDGPLPGRPGHAAAISGGLWTGLAAIFAILTRL